METSSRSAIELVWQSQRNHFATSPATIITMQQVIGEMLAIDLFGTPATTPYDRMIVFSLNPLVADGTRDSPVKDSPHE